MTTTRAAWRHLVACRTTPPGGPLPLWLDDEPTDRERLAELLPSPTVTRPEPAPGQVWQISPSLAGWPRPGHYLRPGLALVLDPVAGGGVWLAPLMDTPELAGPGDVLLGEALGVAEAWNTVILPAAALDVCLATVDEVVVEQVRQASQATHQPPAPDTLAAAVRALEREVAQWAAAQAWRLPQKLRDPETARAKVLAFHPGIKPGEGATGLEVLALATLPPELMDLAASGTDGLLHYTQVILGSEDLPCHGFFAEEHQRRLDGSTVRLTGRLHPGARCGTLHAWWQHGHDLRQGACRLDQESGLFRADIPGIDPLAYFEGRPVLLLVSDVEDLTPEAHGREPR